MTSINKNCNTCMSENEQNSIPCFCGCSYSQCNVCISKWLKIEDKLPSYKCPQCRKQTYFKNLDEHNITNQDNLFSNWCRYNADEIIKIYSKHDFSEQENDLDDLPDLISVDEAEDEYIVSNSEYRSDMANIRNHMPDLYNNMTNSDITQNEAILVDTSNHFERNQSSDNIGETLFSNMPDLFETHRDSSHDEMISQVFRMFANDI